MNRFGWLFGTRIADPSPGLSYPAVLRREPLSTSAATSLGGVLAILAGYVVIVPGLAWLLVACAWVLNGTPGHFGVYREQAIGFQHLSGMVATHLAIGALVLLVLVVVARVHHLAPKWACSVQPGFRWRYALATLLVAVVMLNSVHWLSRWDDPPTWNPGAGWGWWMLAIVLTAPLQAAGEEFFFRGYLLQASGILGRANWVAVVVSALIFAGLHGTQDVPLFVDRLGFGLLIGTLVVLTGGLEAAFGVHAVKYVCGFGYAVAGNGV